MFVEHLSQRSPPRLRTEPVELRDERRVGAEQDLVHRRESQELADDRAQVARDEQLDLAEIRVDVWVHRREVGQRADIGVAGVEQHDRGRPVRIREEQPEAGRIGLGQVEIRVAEPRVELDRDLLAGRLLDSGEDQEVEQRLRLDPQPAVAAGHLVDWAERRRGSRPIDPLELQPGTVGQDRLHRDVARPAQVRESRPVGVEEPVEVGRREDQPLDQRLEPDDLADVAGDEAAELVEPERGVGAVAGVDEPSLEVGPLDDLASQALEPAFATSGVDRGRLRLTTEQRCQLADRPVVDEGVWDVPPRDLRDRRFGQVVSERLVVLWLVPEERMAVVVDDRDGGQVERHLDCAPLST